MSHIKLQDVVEEGDTPATGPGTANSPNPFPSSQKSGSSELAERMENINLVEQPLNRSQRRLLEFLKTRWDIVEDEAY